MWRCSSLIFFLPLAVESVNTTGHYDLTIVHQISILLGQNISCDSARKF